MKTEKYTLKKETEKLIERSKKIEKKREDDKDNKQGE